MDLALLFFLVQCPYPLPFPFFPKEALRRGVTEAEVGVILASCDIG